MQVTVEQLSISTNSPHFAETYRIDSQGLSTLTRGRDWMNDRLLASGALTRFVHPEFELVSESGKWTAKETELDETEVSKLMKNLENLFIIDGFSETPWGYFSDLKNLKSLVISSFAMTSWPKDLPSSLKSLSLGNSFLEDIPRDAFINLRGLEFFGVYNANLSEIHEGAFDELPLLEKLILGRNKIEKIPRKLFYYNKQSL